MAARPPATGREIIFAFPDDTRPALRPNAVVLAHDLPLRGNHDPLWIDPGADRSVGQGINTQGWLADVVARVADTPQNRLSSPAVELVPICRHSESSLTSALTDA
jgi:hypothetical protein